MCHSNEWGTVCDDNWGAVDGMVVCHQLGAVFIAVARAASFGRGAGKIWLDDVACAGPESRLIDCFHNGFGVHNCAHSNDASVICRGMCPYYSIIFCKHTYSVLSYSTVVLYIGIMKIRCFWCQLLP